MGGNSVKENLTGGINEGDFAGKGGVGRIHKKFRVIWSELGTIEKWLDRKWTSAPKAEAKSSIVFLANVRQFYSFLR